MDQNSDLDHQANPLFQQLQGRLIDTPYYYLFIPYGKKLLNNSLFICLL